MSGGIAEQERDREKTRTAILNLLPHLADLIDQLADRHAPSSPSAFATLWVLETQAREMEMFLIGYLGVMDGERGKR